jgi:DNA-binding transcriptional MerR regulator
MAVFLTISDVARASGLSVHTLRYYERVGLLEPIDRAASGHRRYEEEDLERIQFLIRLRATGMPIRQIREYAELMRGGESTHADRMALLESHRAAVLEQLEQTTRNLDLIETKINYYRERLSES